MYLKNGGKFFLNCIFLVILYHQELMPIADRTSKALLNFSKSQDGQLTPTFPSFLPLEIFDNTEFDCRTPEDWLSLGVDDSGVRKPVPGKALLPVVGPGGGLASDHAPQKPVVVTKRQLTPTPPKSQPTDTQKKSFRKFYCDPENSWAKNV